MSDTPTSKVEALRESIGQLTADHGQTIDIGKRILVPITVEEAFEAFATFLERVPGVAKRDLVEPVTKRPVKHVGDKVGIDLEADLHGSLKFIQDDGYNQAIDCYDEALHQVVTVLRGGLS